jgi:small-conductance mechanosensitive channel
MEAFFQQILFNYNETAITIGMVIAVFVMGLFTLLVYYIGVKKMLNIYQKKEGINPQTQKKVNRLIGLTLLVFFLIASLSFLELDGALLPDYSPLSWSSILKGILIIQLARLIKYFIQKVIDDYYNEQVTVTTKEEHQQSLDKILRQDSNKLANTSIRAAIYIFALFLLIQNFSINYTLLRFNEGKENAFDLDISNILVFTLILLLGRIFIWGLTQLILRGYYQKNKINVGTRFAINQLITYLIYVIAIVSALHFLGIKMTVVWGGLAALLVGIGLGLQQTFNDLFSGILLLFERGIEVGETVEIDGLIGNVKKIGLRTSIIESRDNITVIVPNSKLVVNNVINWSHYDDKVRFIIQVGVAYGSDTTLVKNILLEVAKEHSFVLKYPKPIIRFTNFGNSSLDFELLFYSKNFIIIEDIKSDLRFEIDRKFRENKIEIPFPQRDVWIRK